jgi:MSHA biogenesis protein MshJ
MKEQWQTLLARVDALSLRERVFLFMSVFVCVLAAADFVWFTPATVGHRQLIQRFAAQSGELDRLRSELRLAGVRVDPSRQVRDDLLAVQKQVAELNAELAKAAPTDQKGPALEAVLQRLLRRQEGLTLLSLDTVKAEAVSPSGPAVIGNLPSGMTKRGLEIRVAGPYAGLVRYVQALEATLPGLRWGAMELKSEKRSTSELTLRVYAVGVEL